MRWIIRPRTRLQAIGSGVLLYNPLLAVGFTLTFHGVSSSSFRQWLVTLTITNVAMVQAVVLGGFVEYLLRKRQSLNAAWKPAHRLIVSIGTLPLVLPLSFRLGSLVSTALGRPWRVADWQDYRIGLAFGLIITALFFYRSARADARERELEAEAKIGALENAQLKAQVSALTAEMNPHLLFNALNTVAALVHDDPNRAEDVVVELSTLYRGVLQSARSTEHALQTELTLCQAYLRVEQARFGDRLRVHVHVDAGVNMDAVSVPVLLLQPIVENAVRHGIGSRVTGGSVTIRAHQKDNQLSLMVSDDGVGMGNAPESNGSGKALDNVRERLVLLYEDQASLCITSDGGTTVTLTLPMKPT